MKTIFQSDVWIERRIEAVHERFVSGEIDESQYQNAVEKLLRAYDNLVEYADVATPVEAMDGGVEPRRVSAYA